MPIHLSFRQAASTGALLCLSLGLGFAILGFYPPRTPQAQQKLNVLEHPDIADATSQCHEILRVLKANEWDTASVPFRLQLLPDGKNSPRPEYHDGKTSMFVFPRDHGAVAFYTDLYIDPHVSYSAGDVATTEPEGFYLVGYRNGEVRQVPLNDARMAPVTGHPNTRELVLPGMKAYRKTLPVHPYLNLRKKG